MDMQRKQSESSLHWPFYCCHRFIFSPCNANGSDNTVDYQNININYFNIFHNDIANAHNSSDSKEGFDVHLHPQRKEDAGLGL